MHEWPLLIFTLVIQTSIGCLAISTLCAYRLLFKINNELAITIIKKNLLLAFILGIIGSIASIFHLGNPFHIIYSILNIAHSWMSREILFTGFYMGLLFLSIAILVIKKYVPYTCLTITCLVGIIDIFVMSNIYINTIFTLWYNIFTYAAFFGSSLLMGGTITALIMHKEMQSSKLSKERKQVIHIAIIFIAIGIILTLLSVSTLLSVVNEPLSLGFTQQTLPNHLIVQSAIRIILLTFGLCFIGCVLVKQYNNKKISFILLCSTTFITLSESIGRYIFFSLGV